MRFVPASLGALCGALLLAGCGFIHFGRREKSPVGGDAALVAAYANLSTEHKILKQELALVRKEGDALRAALDRGGETASAAESEWRLTEMAKELAAVRANYARLQAERSGGTAEPAAVGPQRGGEEKATVTLREHTELQEENTRLRGELERTRRENAGLEQQIKSLTARHAEAQQALEMLNAELLAQKQARTRAEQATGAARAQLDAVLARGRAPLTSSLAGARESTATSAPTAEFRLDTARLLQGSDAVAAAGSATQPPRRHVVKEGDTLEKIATQYYGAAERWKTIRDANRAILGERNELRPGTELLVP